MRSKMRRIMQKFSFKFNKKNILIIAAVLLVVVLALAVNKEPKSISYEGYMQLLSGNFIDKAVIDEDDVILYAQNNRYKIIKDGVDIKELVKKVPVERAQNYIVMLTILKA